MKINPLVLEALKKNGFSGLNASSRMPTEAVNGLVSEFNLKKDEAIQWYRLAAEQGHVKAQNNLGACFFNGEGVSKNLQEALNWFEKAAKAGNKKAKESVSRVHELLEIKKRKEAETCTTSTDSIEKSSSKMSVEDAVGMIAKLAMLDNINEAIEGIQSELDSIEDTLYTMQESIERIEKAVATRKKKNHSS